MPTLDTWTSPYLKKYKEESINLENGEVCPSFGGTYDICSVCLPSHIKLST